MVVRPTYLRILFLVIRLDDKLHRKGADGLSIIVREN